jgi:hypothetical protein
MTDLTHNLGQALGWYDEPDGELVIDGYANPDGSGERNWSAANTDVETCESCGYILAVHTTAPDPTGYGGCPRNEIVALQRWGLL